MNRTSKKQDRNPQASKATLQASKVPEAIFQLGGTQKLHSALVGGIGGCDRNGLTEGSK